MELNISGTSSLLISLYFLHSFLDKPSSSQFCDHWVNFKMFYRLWLCGLSIFFFWVFIFWNPTDCTKIWRTIFTLPLTAWLCVRPIPFAWIYLWSSAGCPISLLLSKLVHCRTWLPKKGLGGGIISTLGRRIVDRRKYEIIWLFWKTRKPFSAFYVLREITNPLSFFLYRIQNACPAWALWALT